MTAENQPSNHAERNSPLRALTNAPERIARSIDYVAPWLTADHITCGATILTISLAALAAKNNANPGKHQKLYAGLIGVGLAVCLGLDVVDGARARLLAERSIVPVDPVHGQIVDASCDGLQEAALGLSRAVSAHERGDFLGEILAYFAVITNNIPRYLKAKAVAAGRTVHESGKNVILFIGTRGGRASPGIIGALKPVMGGKNIQPTLDGITTFGNITNSIDRANEERRARQGQVMLDLPAEDRINAATRARALLYLEFGIVGVTALTALLLNIPRKKDRM